MDANRRTVVSVPATLALPPAAGRTQGTTRRIAWFGVGPSETVLPYLGALQAGLRESGWDQGRNLAIGRYNSARAPEDFESIVREIIAAKPDVVVAQEYATLAMRDIYRALAAYVDRILRGARRVHAVRASVRGRSVPAHAPRRCSRYRPPPRRLNKSRAMIER